MLIAAIEIFLWRLSSLYWYKIRADAGRKEHGSGLQHWRGRSREVTGIVKVMDMPHCMPNTWKKDLACCSSKATVTRSWSKRLSIIQDKMPGCYISCMSAVYLPVQQKVETHTVWASLCKNAKKITHTKSKTTLSILSGSVHFFMHLGKTN